MIRTTTTGWRSTKFTVVGPQGHNRRADVVIFVNGLPLGVIELKNPADEKATVGGALNQLQTYREQVATQQEREDRLPSIAPACCFAPPSSPGRYADPSSRCWADHSSRTTETVNRPPARRFP